VFDAVVAAAVPQDGETADVSCQGKACLFCWVLVLATANATLTLCCLLVLQLRQHLLYMMQPPSLLLLLLLL
jgi:hypothetical protein